MQKYKKVCFSSTILKDIILLTVNVNCVCLQSKNHKQDAKADLNLIHFRDLSGNSLDGAITGDTFQGLGHIQTL